MSDKKRFNIFNLNKNGKGVTKEETLDEDIPNLKNFFKKYKRKFGNLLTVNILMVLGNFPLLFAVIAMAGYFNYNSTIPSSPLFAQLNGIITHSATPAAAGLYGVIGQQYELSVPSPATWVLFGLAALVIFTFGLTNVGTTYILRNMVRGDAVFMWTDFRYAIKRNLRQGIVMGILDLIISVLLVLDINFYYYNLGTFINGILFWISLVMIVLWFCMRFYMYILLVTFDLSIFKIIKNSLIFSIIGFKRNFMATLGILALAIINYYVFALVMPIGIVLPLVLLFANGAFMSTYAAYYKIKEIMIDPYEQKKDENDVEQISDDSISHE